MCGIIACCLREGDATKVVLEGLKRLEYRGYDSAGIAVQVAGGVSLMKRMGRIAVLEEAIAEAPLPPAVVGIGHTRWATHGVPAERNAHPHVGDEGALALIHNGIIENHHLLRETLEAKGFTFRSETDSEVLAHLVTSHLGKPAAGAGTGTGTGTGPRPASVLVEAVRKALREVTGSYAIAVMHKAWPGLIVCARKDNPLVIGVSPRGNFLASDVPAILDRTRDVIFLHDDEVAEVTVDHVGIWNLDGRRVDRKPERITWDAEAVEKGGYEHYMLKEIEEQGDVLGRTLQGRLSDEHGDVVLEDLDLSDDELRQVKRLKIVACGTSLHAGLVGKFLIEHDARLPVDVDFASEFRYREPITGGDELVLAISQSGETADTLGAMREAARRGAVPIAICNVEGSSLTRESRGVILTDAGPEIGVASTKAFVGQLVALELLSIRLARARGAMSPPQARARIDQLRHLKAVLDHQLSKGAREAVQRVADRHCDKPGFLFIGRGINYPIALEGALKLKEISYVHAEGYPAGEMKHGPIALISPDMVVVMIATAGRTYEKVVSNMQEVRARAGRIVAIAHEGAHEVFKHAEEVIVVPHVDEVLSPIVNVIPLQYFAYFIAKRRGCDIDKPRNLAKSVTVE